MVFAYLAHYLHATSILFRMLLFPVLIACSIFSFFYVERPARTFILHRARIRPVVPQEQKRWQVSRPCILRQESRQKRRGTISMNDIVREDME